METLGRPAEPACPQPGTMINSQDRVLTPADPRIEVQRVLGHASAAMTMDLYGHLIDQNLWDAAARLGDISGTFLDLGQPLVEHAETEVGSG